MQISLQQLLSVGDISRASRTLLKKHNTQGWALAGGLTVEAHRLLRGCEAAERGLNDIAFIAGSFDDIPQSLASDSLFRHIHPFDPPGKTLLQPIDAESALRVDVFRARSPQAPGTQSLSLKRASYSAFLSADPPVVLSRWDIAN